MLLRQKKVLNKLKMSIIPTAINFLVEKLLLKNST